MLPRSGRSRSQLFILCEASPTRFPFLIWRASFTLGWCVSRSCPHTVQYVLHISGFSKRLEYGMFRNRPRGWWSVAKLVKPLTLTPVSKYCLAMKRLLLIRALWRMSSEVLRWRIEGNTKMNWPTCRYDLAINDTTNPVEIYQVSQSRRISRNHQFCRINENRSTDGPCSISGSPKMSWWVKPYATLSLFLYRCTHTLITRRCRLWDRYPKAW